jgi:hypothetical protein
MRSQVASRVGELIWNSSTGGGQAAFMVRRGSLAAVLAAVEECINQHGGPGQLPGLEAAFAELRAALPPERRPARNSK